MSHGGTNRAKLRNHGCLLACASCTTRAERYQASASWHGGHGTPAMELFNADERRVKALFIRASPPMLTNPPLAIASSAILALLAALLVFAVYFSFRFGCEKFRHGYRAQELPSDYAFSSSTAVRALETTRLAYTAPVHPDIRRFNPIIFRVFDRSGVSSAQ